MRLKSYMIKLIYRTDTLREINELQVEDVIILDEANYKTDTVLGTDKEKYWVTYTHYRVKDSDGMFYQLGFELFDLKEDEKNNEYNLFILNEVKFNFINSNELDTQLKYFITSEGRKIYFDQAEGKIKNKQVKFNSVPVGLDTSGFFYIGVFDRLGNKVYMSPPIYVLPSSLSKEDYDEMINDLIRIKDDIVINKNSKVSIKGYWDLKREIIEDFINNIKNPILKINQSPAVTLFPEWKKSNYKIYKSIKSKTLIEKMIFTYRNKYAIQTYSESVDIYENRIIKYSLLRLKDKINNYIKAYDKEYDIENKEINDIINEFENRKNKNIEDELKYLNEEILKREKEIDIIQIRNKVEKIINMPVNNISTDVVCVKFKLYKIDTIRNIDISLENDRCVLGVKSTENEENRLDLSLGFGEYKYNFSINEGWKTSKFKSKFANFQIETSNLNEIAFIIDRIIETDKTEIEIIANVKKENQKPDDPLLKEDKGKYGIYNIKFIKIFKINDEDVLQYDTDRILDKLIKYIINSKYKELDSLKENKLFVEAMVNRKSKINRNNVISNKVYWENILKQIDALLSIDIFKKVNSLQLSLKPTQVFVNDSNYKIIWRHLKRLDDQIDFITDFNNCFSEKNYLVKSTHNIYEYWCFFKIIQILVVEQKWTLENYNEIFRDLYLYLNENAKIGSKDLKARLSHKLENGNKLELVMSYNKEVLDNNNRTLRPDYKLEFKKSSAKYNVYVDAKYRNYNEQIESAWYKDLKDVAINKYIKRFEYTQNNATSSFIVHPNIEGKWIYFGSFLDEKMRNELEWENEAPMHMFGSIGLLPSKTIFLKTFIKMILEYHIKLYDYCWNCGEIEDIKKEEKKTEKGYTKYHYACNKCGEFWVKTHCDKSGHDLIKHIFNYHKPKENNYPWYVECPNCLVSIQQDNYKYFANYNFIDLFEELPF